MVGSVGASAGTTASKLSDVQNQAKEMKATTASLKDKYQHLLQQEGKIQADAIAETNKTLKKVQTLSGRLRASHALFQDQMRTFEVIGIVFVSFIFLMLLMKRFDVFSTIDNYFFPSKK